MKTDFHGKKVAILGFGINNAELVPFLSARGAEVTICDKNASLPQDNAKVTYRLGSDYLANLSDFDYLFRTPGLPYLTPEIRAAKSEGVVITSQTQLFLEECEAQTIAVTGTKGKGTTASLIECAFRAAKENGTLTGEVFIAGNIGASALGLLEKAEPSDWVILELSSFQLQDMTKSPHIAVVLNITSDHLDHHGSVEEYHSAKKNIVRHQTFDDFAVLFQDSDISTSFASETPAEVYYFSRSHEVPRGAFVQDDMVYFRDGASGTQPICAIGDIKLQGAHNLENVAAAVTASALAGLDFESIKSGVTTFSGLHYRLELVAELDGVRYFNDSKSTTPDSTIAAIQAFQEPITLIAGGSSKGADFGKLVSAIAHSSIERVIVIGEEGIRLKVLLADTPVTVIEGADTMKEIVAQAKSMTKPGSVVLLSPAAASFGMFKNAEDRGEQFTQAVRALS